MHCKTAILLIFATCNSVSRSSFLAKPVLSLPPALLFHCVCFFQFSNRPKTYFCSPESPSYFKNSRTPACQKCMQQQIFPTRDQLTKCPSVSRAASDLEESNSNLTAYHPLFFIFAFLLLKESENQPQTLEEQTAAHDEEEHVCN